jgi:hypothetical protein
VSSFKPDTEAKLAAMLISSVSAPKAYVLAGAEEIASNIAILAPVISAVAGALADAFDVGANASLAALRAVLPADMIPELDLAMTFNIASVESALFDELDTYASEAVAGARRVARHTTIAAVVLAAACAVIALISFKTNRSMSATGIAMACLSGGYGAVRIGLVKASEVAGRAGYTTDITVWVSPVLLGFAIAAALLSWLARTEKDLVDEVTEEEMIELGSRLIKVGSTTNPCTDDELAKVLQTVGVLGAYLDNGLMSYDESKNTYMFTAADHFEALPDNTYSLSPSNLDNGVFASGLCMSMVRKEVVILAEGAVLEEVAIMNRKENL